MQIGKLLKWRKPMDLSESVVNSGKQLLCNCWKWTLYYLFWFWEDLPHCIMLQPLSLFKLSIELITWPGELLVHSPTLDSRVWCACVLLFWFSFVSLNSLLILICWLTLCGKIIEFISSWACSFCQQIDFTDIMPIK